MKALTILQPWASLIACGEKQIETRSRAMKYRGPIAIHAGKRDGQQMIGSALHIEIRFIPLCGQI
jgi:hypothetical protein